MTVETLRITEIFYSLQGETRTVGLPTVFVRLTGCPLRCGYCDTEYAFHGGEVRPIVEIVDEVASHQPRYVTVTGGEPLAQREGCLELLRLLCDKGFEVSLETSGAMPIDGVDERVVTVLDLKTPSSGEMSKNLYENIPFLKSQDQVKFVIADDADYQWSRFKADEFQLAQRVDEVLFSPVANQLNPADLAAWILRDNLAVRMQLQLHKIIWNDEPGR